MKKLTTEDKRKRIIAWDIIEVFEESRADKYDYLVTLMTGDGTSPALTWSKAMVEKEYAEGEYEGKEEGVKQSIGYELVRELWP